MDYAKIFLSPLKELGVALIDQTHFHVKAFLFYASIAGKIVVDFIKSCFIFYYAHVCHLLYLKQIGFLGKHTDLLAPSPMYTYIQM
jgi:hypothetical protein